ncbi:hypothetical protein [Aeromicrobium sp.]|uniref:hypothetical protein n=1 Tax=Aeromicrobium sp. TaxID=1871063 RepID=UPI0028AEA78A|nr:hypothetical protein [Aeromicrobium sp.]
MPIIAGSRLRAGAIGLALGAAVTGLLQALGTVSVLIVLSRSLDQASWGSPRLAMSVSLLVFGIAAGLAWASVRAGRLAAVVALLSAVGIAGAAVWAAKPTVELGLWGGALRQLAFGAALAMLVAAVGWVWSRASSGSVRVVDVALGAVLGMAAARLGDAVETALYLDDVPPGEHRTSMVIGAAAAALLTIAALLAVMALAGRVPVVAVASLVLAAGGLLALVVLRDVTSMELLIVGANDRHQLSVLVGLASGAGQALLAVGLGWVLVAARRGPTRSVDPYGSTEASASRRAQTP